jgi:hypothetical protein
MIPRPAHAEDAPAPVAAARSRIPGRSPWGRFKLIGVFIREIREVWRAYGLRPALTQIKDVLLARDRGGQDWGDT